MNFNLILIWKLEILKSLGLLPINTSLVTFWGLEIRAKILAIRDRRDLIVRDPRDLIVRGLSFFKGIIWRKNLIFQTIHILSFKDLSIWLLVEDRNPFRGTKGFTMDQ